MPFENVYRCPYCGAELKYKNAEKCDYCGTILTGGRKDKTELKYEEEPGAPKTSRVVLGIMVIAVIIMMVIAGISYLLIYLKEGEDEKKVKKSEETYVIKKENIEVEKSGSGRTPLILYKSQDITAQPQQIIMESVDYEILKRDGEWVYVRTGDGREGWTLKDLLETY